MIFRFWAHKELTLCHVVGKFKEMLFLLAADCSKLLLVDAWSTTVPFMYVFVLQETPSLSQV